MLWRVLADLLWRGTRVCTVALAVICSAWAAPASLGSEESFEFGIDTFAYANELKAEYVYDVVSGRMQMEPRVPRPDYALRCFTVTRGARQFFDHARFEPNEPKATHAVYRHLIRLVVGRSPRESSRPDDRITIPGFANLHEFSAEYGALLKAESGGAWRSFVQRGNWRMVFPFTRRHQHRTAESLVESIEDGRPPIVHLVCFPDLTLNHAILLFGFERTAGELRFDAYDPNDPNRPACLEYRQRERQFLFPANDYFMGGAVDVYEIYRGWCY